MFYREKKIFSGKMLEIEIFPISGKEKNKTRKEKKKYSEPKQKNLNSKNAMKHLIRLVNRNFTSKDLAVHLTYNQKNLPKTEEEARKDVTNFIRRIKHYIKKNKLPALKYIAVIEFKEPEGNQKAIRMHHHIIMSGDMDRDIVEKLWNKGRANADRLQEDDDTQFEALARYIAKDPKGKKRWLQSKNLLQPVIEPNDTKYRSRRKIENLAKCPDVSEYFEKDQKGEYKFLEFEPKYYDEIGWTLYVKMRKKDNLINQSKEEESDNFV